MDEFRELRRRERAQAALRRIYGGTKLARNRAYGLFQIHDRESTWTGTAAQTKPIRTLQRMDSSSSSDARDTSGPMVSNTSETGTGPSAETTER